MADIDVTRYLDECAPENLIAFWHVGYVDGEHEQQWWIDELERLRALCRGGGGTGGPLLWDNGLAAQWLVPGSTPAAVPGPQAGDGLLFVALAAALVLLNRRRKTWPSIFAAS